MSARILVIEDDAASRELLGVLLAAFGLQASAAADGESGLAAARRERPHLVLCDLQLPGIDGFQVVERLRAEPGLRATKVIAVTALAMRGDRERILAAGFDGYLAKPIQPEFLLAQLRPFLPQPAAPAP